MSVKEELKPCPFCGVPYPYIVRVPGRMDDTVGIFCNSCKQTVVLEENEEEGLSATTIEKATKAWNRDWRCG